MPLTKDKLSSLQRMNSRDKRHNRAGENVNLYFTYILNVYQVIKWFSLLELSVAAQYGLLKKD